jgi:hypothetical protein
MLAARDGEDRNEPVRRPGRWRGWRRSRPFAGALLAICGGAEIAAVRLSLPMRSPHTIVPGGLLIAGAMVICGVLLLAYPVQRSGYATVVILLAVAALSTAHLGGYLAGALLGAGGGAVAFAWVPAIAVRPRDDRDERGGRPGTRED